VVEVPVQIIEAVESPQLRATLRGHADSVGHLAWAKDGKTLATLSYAGSHVQLWDVARGKVRTTIQSDLGDSYGLALTPDGETLALGHWKRDAQGGTTGGISLQDTATGRRRGLLQHKPSCGVSRLILSPGGKTLAAAEYKKGVKDREFERRVTLWDLPSGKPLTSLNFGNPTALAFSPDGKVLACASWAIKDNKVDGVEVRRRDLTARRDLPPLVNTASKNPINSLAFSPDGRTLAGADYEGNILLWDTAKATVRTTLKQEGRRRIHALAFAADGKTLAAAVGDHPERDHEPGLVVLWDVRAGRPRLTLTGHRNAVLSVAFRPDGKLLASGSADRTVRLWDVSALLEANARR
jgi:WD40 repeat protein